MFFFPFLFFLLGLISALYSPFYLFLLLGPVSYLVYRKKEKEILPYLFFALAGFLLLFFFPHGEGEKEITGIVLRKKDSYYLLFSFKGSFYIKSKDSDITLFSLVHLEGESKELSFSHYESGFSFENYLHSQGVYRQFYPSDGKVLFQNPISSDPLKNYLFSSCDEKSSAVLSSLLFADSLSELEEYTVLEELGLSSLLSLSGFHLSFFFTLLRKVLGEKKEKLSDFLVLSLLLLFLFFSSFRYTLRRIFLLLFLSFLNRRKGRKLERLDIVSLSALILLFFEPNSLLSPAFYVPFPLLFLLAFFPSKRERGIKSRITFFLVLFLFLLPYRLFDNSGFSFLSPIYQLVLIPYSHLLFLSGLSLFFIPQTGFLISYLVKGYLSLSKVISASAVFLISGRPKILFFFLYYGILFLFLLFTRYHFQQSRIRAAFSLALVTSFLFVPDVLPHQEITFLDVDQGDSTLVRYRRTNILIDTGGKKNVDLATECLIPYFRSQKISSLDAVLLTHYDYDHSGAKDSLVSHFSVNNVYDQKDFLNSTNNSISFSGLTITNLNIYASDQDEENDQSAVYSFTLGKKKILIMGDAPKEIEKKILADHPTLKADILKVGHHGSETSTDPTFVKAIDPSIAIISCGENNSYGHPHKATLKTLEENNIPIYRTDQMGTITIRC